MLKLQSSWPEMTDIINILIRCEFAYHVKGRFPLSGIFRAQRNFSLSFFD